VIMTPVVPTYFDYAQSDGDTEPLSIGGPVTVEDVAALRPVPDGWPDHAARHLIGAQFQVWTEYIPDPRALDYMTFPRACAFAEVAWRGAAGWTQPEAPDQGQPPLRDRLKQHLGRLAAAGIEYRPLNGPRPWQQGGTGPRRHQAGYPAAEVTTHLAGLAAGDQEQPG
jgi:hexosaminidase